jgi:hypothetical protein
MSIFTPFAFYGSQAVAPAALPDITGGTVNTFTSGGITYRSHKFTGDGTLVVTSLGNLSTAQLLVVAGGGAGGFGNTSGGGGAGGYILSSSYALTTTTYNVKIGAGGAANTNNANSGSPGNLSGFFNVTASGGGGGMADGANITSLAGGSGGGAGVNYPNTVGAGIFGQGFSGSRGLLAPPYPAGGGGGANNAGGTGSYRNAGGSGSFNSLELGTAQSYAGGGFGGSQFDNNTFAIFTSGSTGGSGRGANRSYPSAATFAQSSSAGLTNLGGGGGGGAGDAGAGSRNGSPGGSGVVIVTYLYQ